MNLEEEFSDLQRLFAQTDMLSEPRGSGRSGFLEILLVKRERIKIKIYQEIGHRLPHIHIDYGKQKHFASYKISSGERLDGNLAKKYDRDVSSWLERNRSKVLEIWESLQLGGNVEPLVAELAP